MRMKHYGIRVVLVRSLGGGRTQEISERVLEMPAYSHAEAIGSAKNEIRGYAVMGGTHWEIRDDRAAWNDAHSQATASGHRIDASKDRRGTNHKHTAGRTPCPKCGV